jgi:hypothetical protein
MAEFTVTPVEGMEDGNGRIYCTGSVSFPEHENHEPNGEPLEDMLVFPIEVYMPTGESARNTAMQEYADEYESSYWQLVGEGHRTNLDEGE